jgi:hypothetical protein
MAQILQTNGCIYNKTLSASDAQVGVEEDDVLRARFGGHDV